MEESGGERGRAGKEGEQEPQNSGNDPPISVAKP